MINREEILARLQASAERAEARLIELITDERLTEAQRNQVKRTLKKWRGESASGAKRRRKGARGIQSQEC
jgi:hypothetical protein